MATRKMSDGNGNGLRVTIDTLPDLRAALKVLIRDEVLVGFPEETTERDEPEERAAGITNAALGYIHDNGAPEARIPARPFMIPGMTAVQGPVTDLLAKQAQYVLKGDAIKVSEGNTRLGMMVVDSIRATIVAGIPPPLAELTLKKRAARGRKGAKEELTRRANGYGASLDLAKPLIDTGEMMKSVTYVVRNRNKRRK